MWTLDNNTRFFTVRIVNTADSPVTTRVLADFQISFQRNGASCQDPLTFLNNGDGTYRFSYTPSGFGQDVLAVYDPPTDLRFVNVEDVYNFGTGGAIYCLNQDFGGSGRLRATVASPAGYRMLVFGSADWAANRRSDAYSYGASGLDAEGNWLTDIYVPGGTYHVIAQKSGSFTVVAANLAAG